MRAVRFARFGEPSEVLTVEDAPLPEPGPGEVRVRLRARPINPSDLFAIRGRYGVLPKLPATPGLEGAGVVDALADGVTRVRKGQQVIPLGGAGTWQEYAVVPEDLLIPLPDGLTDAQAAMLLVNPTTAWLMIEELGVKPGDWVAQNAANSAVGRFVIQLGRRLGFHTLNVVRRRELSGELLADGADRVICEVDEDVVARIREATGGTGARYALDSVAGESGSRLLQALAPGGTMLVFGAISQQPLTVDPGQMLFRGTTVRGWWLTRWLRTASEEARRRLFETIVPLVRDGTLRAAVAAEYDLADVKAAVAAAEGSERNGKILLVG